jgi:hypothetical protein
MQRDLVIREPDPSSDQDFVYGISNINVSSPDPGVATQFSSTTTESQGGREAELNIRIGDPNQTISADTATYVISYDVTGAMRSFIGYDEFFWDGPGFGNPLIKTLKITTTVPGGVQDTSCFAGPPGSTTPCETKKFTKGGTATFGQTNVPRGQSVSIGVKITPGLVADNKPHMEPNGSKLSPTEWVGATALAAVSGLIAIGAPHCRCVVVAQERPRPTLRRPGARHRSACWSRGTGRAQRSRYSYSGGVFAAADPRG